MAVVDYIISAKLVHAECTGGCACGCNAGCLVVWTANAHEQIGQRVKELLDEDLVP